MLASGLSISTKSPAGGDTAWRRPRAAINVRYTSRHKLNKHHLNGIVVFAAIFAALAGSAQLFIIICVVLLAIGITNGDVWISSRR